MTTLQEETRRIHILPWGVERFCAGPGTLRVPVTIGGGGSSRRIPFNPKLGIDNPALSLGEDGGACSDPLVRFCVLRKDKEGSFGFHLMTELEREGHVIHQVVPGGPAYLGGLRDGDQLLQINGEYVHEQEHLRVGQKLKSSGSHVSLCVLDEEAYQRLCFSHMSPASVLPKPVPETCPRPRLCLIQREGRGFGFTATATGGVRGTFLLEVDEGGPAHRAGVPLGARLLEVNGESVSSITMSQLTKKLQNSGPRVTLLVLEASAWDVYEGHGVTLNAVLAETSSLPYRTRKLHLVRGPKGYGFLLRQENCLGGQGQFLRDLDLGLPAQESGMREGDRLLAVNGQSVDGREHEDIVSLIQGSGQQVTMLVISNEGDRFYCEIGLSPLLFYEDDASDCVAAKNMAASTPHLQDQREGKDPQIPTPPAGAQSSEE